LAKDNWLQERTGEPAKLDLEEVRRIAREEWLNKYALTSGLSLMLASEQIVAQFG
jgi:hypothetical protein